jgi:hypothetical protein
VTGFNWDAPPPTDIIGMLTMMAGGDRAVVEALVAQTRAKDPTASEAAVGASLAAGMAYGSALSSVAVLVPAMADDDLDEDVIAMLCQVAQANALVAIAGALISLTNRPTAQAPT